MRIINQLRYHYTGLPEIQSGSLSATRIRISKERETKKTTIFAITISKEYKRVNGTRRYIGQQPSKNLTK